MSAYAIFMAPMTGILICDFFVIHRMRYDVPALYDPKGIYYYKVCLCFIDYVHQTLILYGLSL